MDVDKILESMGIKYEQLNAVERETYNNWINELSAQTLTIETIKDHIQVMRSSVEDQLAHEDLSKVKDLYLKARLRNYILLEAMLTSPDKAKKALMNQLSRLGK